MSEEIIIKNSDLDKDILNLETNEKGLVHLHFNFDQL